MEILFSSLQEKFCVIYFHSWKQFFQSSHENSIYIEKHTADQHKTS